MVVIGSVLSNDNNEPSLYDQLVSDQYNDNYIDLFRRYLDHIQDSGRNDLFTPDNVVKNFDRLRDDAGDDGAKIDEFEALLDHLLHILQNEELSNLFKD